MGILKKKFFEKPAATAAKNLLGKYLVRRIGGKIIRLMITEVEVYDGFKDKASHASRGITKRNAPMFGEAGVWYVYFTYGMHWMLNIVTGPKNYPAAILIRAVKGINGPARLTKFLKIDKKFNNNKASMKMGLWIEENPGFKRSKFSVKKLPRIGVAYAEPIWSKKPLRFLLVKNLTGGEK
ncbi:DNA-3-methyladenine glycosylase [Candidatus Azambacteria bacterium]|nr:DNA-3-methyladenine glycosylase [Candidatus Azambacteria bacterium]